MKNQKPDVVSALTTNPTLVSLIGGRVDYQYPDDNSVYPLITYREADNRDFPFGDDLEGASEIVMVIDVWNKDASTSDIAVAVDAVMSGLGFFREFSADLFERTDNLIQKTMRFRKLKVFDGGTGAIPVDPWIEALSQWTETKLAGWTIYRNPFPEGYSRPAVIWVLTGMETEPVSLFLYRVTKRITGIVIGNLPMTQNAAALSIIEGLNSEIKIILDSVNRRYMTIERAIANIAQDALVSGKVNVELSRYTSKPVTDAPIMTKVNLQKNIS